MVIRPKGTKLKGILLPTRRRAGSLFHTASQEGTRFCTQAPLPALDIHHYIAYSRRKFWRNKGHLKTNFRIGGAWKGIPNRRRNF